MQWHWWTVGVTGIDDIYEEPLKPDLVLRAGELSLDECAQQLISYLQRRVSHTHWAITRFYTGNLYNSRYHKYMITSVL